MWKLFGNIFGSIKGSDVIGRIDEWKLTKEESIKYQLEWLRTMPTGFQLAQRFIGISFSIVFLIMVLAAFILLACGQEITHLIEYINITMSNPIMIIFSLFFGGGVIDSIRRKKTVKEVRKTHTEKDRERKKIISEEPDEFLEEELTKREQRRERRQLRKEQRKEDKNE